MTHTPSLSGPIFKFSRETNVVRVENIPQHVNRLDVLALFNTLIGDIRTSQDSEEALEITFFTVDSARKALCMTGYNVAGTALLVSPIMRAASSPAPSHGGQTGRRSDVRRNLYVLGIPFGMTNQSLATLFAPHGVVSHCVILATLDGASRRRGFVVMSTHEEARTAMAALGRSGKGAAGGGMDISWAVVQRSKGFLDGGDRAGVVQQPASSLSSPSPVLCVPLPTESQPLPSLSTTPTSTLLLANLPSLLFGSQDDLRGLVCPFGSVKALRIVSLPTPSSSLGSGSLLSYLQLTIATPAPITPITAAIVQYNGLPAAQDARRALDGESYAGCIVRVAYLVEADAEPASAPEPPLPETPTFPARNGLPPHLLSPSFPPTSRCGLPAHRTMFDGRDVGNQALSGEHLGRQWQGPRHLLQPLYAFPTFPPSESYAAYGANELHGRWIPDSIGVSPLYYSYYLAPCFLLICLPDCSGMFRCSDWDGPALSHWIWTRKTALVWTHGYYSATSATVPATAIKVRSLSLGWIINGSSRHAHYYFWNTLMRMVNFGLPFSSRGSHVRLKQGLLLIPYSLLDSIVPAYDNSTHTINMELSERKPPAIPIYPASHDFQRNLFLELIFLCFVFCSSVLRAVIWEKL